MEFEVLRSPRLRWAAMIIVTIAGIVPPAALGEEPLLGVRDPVPRDVREMYDAGIRYLLKTQGATGAWNDGHAGRNGPGAGRPLGQALELAVRRAVTSAKRNPTGGWRYSADASDADTSVSGAVLMGLLAARNAGIEVPDETIDRAIKYFTTMTGPNGQVGYSGGPGGGSDAVTSIGVLVYVIARQKQLPQYQKALAYLKTQSLDRNLGRGVHPTYTCYYRAQALFQGDVEAWEKWNAGFVQELKKMQDKDGSFGGTIDTALALLALAVNYKFLPVYER